MRFVCFSFRRSGALGKSVFAWVIGYIRNAQIQSSHAVFRVFVYLVSYLKRLSLTCLIYRSIFRRQNQSANGALFPMATVLLCIAVQGDLQGNPWVRFGKKASQPSQGRSILEGGH